MNKIIKKAFITILAVIICLNPVFVCVSSAVSYPDGVTKEDCEQVIPKLDKVIPELMKMTGKTLDQLIYGAIITDDTLNGLFKSVYSELTENASSLSMMGVDLTPSTLASALSDYPGVSGKIASCQSLEEVIKASEEFKWNVNTKNGFAYAAAAMFSPFNDLLNAVLCSGTAQINILLAIKGDDGYSNAVIPLLKTLSCPSIMSSADFAASAQQNKNNIVSNIVMMLFSAIDNIIAQPGEGICTVLPSVAWYINEGKLSASIEQITDPLALRIGIVTVPGITKLLSTITGLLNSGDSNILPDINISSLTGSSGDTLKLPELDIKALAECGTASGDTFTPDKGAALVTVTEWLVKTVKMNADKLTVDSPELSDILKALTEKSESELTKAFLLLLKGDASSYPNPFVWTYPEYTPSAIISTPNLSMTDYQTALEKIDPFLDEVAAEKTPGSTVKTVIAPIIYSNSLLSTLTSAVYSAIGSEKTAPIFELLGISVTPSGLADTIARSHPAAANTLKKLSSWDDFPSDPLYFGFEDGDAEGFKNAIADVLSPFIPALKYFLAEGKLTVLDVIELNGSDGYNSAVIPLLEALGCPSESIKTYTQYKLTADTSALTDILDPITALLDRICEKPVSTLCSILPNLVYFLDANGLKNCISNLIYPITAKLEQLGLSGLMSAEMLDTSEFDIGKLIEKALDSSDLKLKIPSPDFSKLAVYGEKTTLISKRTVQGAEAAYTYIKADSPAVLLTIFRYLVNTLSLEENSEVLSGLMSSVMDSSSDEESDGPDMVGMYTESIGEKFKGMTTDEIIEWLYNLLFRETPKVEPEDDFIPTIIYEKEKEPNKGLTAFIIIAAVVASVLLLIILDKHHKFDSIKKKRKAKKTKKAEKEEKEKPDKKHAKQAVRATTNRSDLLMPLSEDITAPNQKSANTQTKADKKAARAAANIKKGKSKAQDKRLKRQHKADKLALKQQKRADRYYKQALKESTKQNSKKGGRV